MTKPSELRIGNWLQLTDNDNLIYFKVNGIYENMIWEYKSKVALPPVYEPIPITPEILEQCGFEIIYPAHDDKRMLSSRYIADNKNSRIVFDYNKRIILIDINETIIKHYFLFNHLHQLQNLYFALTGEELEINL